MVFSLNNLVQSQNPVKIYSDEEGECHGIGARRSNGAVRFDFVELRHDGVSGSPASVELPRGVFPSPSQVVHPIVIRRDVDYNISIYGYNGDRIGYIPAVISEDTYEEIQENIDSASKGPAIGVQGRTDGNLRITRLGDGADGTTTTSKQFWSRFGVIAKDVGADLASSIATQLHTHYQP